MGVRAQVVQRQFVDIVIEFTSIVPAHWPETFVNFAHNTQDDMRLLLSALMPVQYSGMIHGLLVQTIQNSSLPLRNIDELENPMNLSDGTVEELKKFGAMPYSFEVTVPQCTAPAVCSEDTHSEQIVAECFALGAHIMYCKLPEERVNHYLRCVPVSGILEGQKWVTARCTEEIEANRTNP